jgi:hypothetical protein
MKAIVCDKCGNDKRVVAERINELIHELCSDEDEYTALGSRVHCLTELMDALGIKGNVLVNNTNMMYPYIEVRWE